MVRGGAIGDFVLTLPVLAALRTRFPQARLEVLGYPHIAQLAMLGGFAEEVRSLEHRSLAMFFAPDADLPQEWVGYFRTFSVVISYLFDPDGFFEGNVKRCCDAVYIAGCHRPDANGSLHATDSLLEALQRLAILDADPVPRLAAPTPPAEPTARASDFLLAVHPGSGSMQKNWPEPRWAELLTRLARTSSCRLLLVGGEAEGDRLERLAHCWPACRLEMARSLNLNTLASRLASCSHFIGHDSGITHLAAALGRPVLALWGKSDDQIWRPRGDSVTILKPSGGLEALAVEDVLSQILPFLTVGEDPQVPDDGLWIQAKETIGGNCS